LTSYPTAKRREELVGNLTGPRNIPKEMEDRVVREYLNGVNPTKLATKLNLSPASVNTILNNRGVERRRRRSAKPEEGTPPVVSGKMTAPNPSMGGSFKKYRSPEDRAKMPTLNGKPWEDAAESLGGEPWPFNGQASQFDKKGPPGLSYFRGEGGDALKKGQWVDCLLWRDDNGILKGIVYHYPQDLSLEKKGNMNVFISPDSKRQGIASILVAEAIERYNVDLRRQRYSEEGAAFINNFVRNLPENTNSVSGKIKRRPNER
jgi:hypothetical protein